MSLPFPPIDPVLLHIWGPIAIRWYSLSYIAGLVCGWVLISRMLKQKSLWKNPTFSGKAPATADDIGDFVVWATLGVIIGGRLGWVIFYGTILCAVTPDGGFCNGLPADFLYHPIRIVSAWDGGMSFHGGVLGLAVATVLFARSRKLNALMLGDLVTSVAPLGLFFGRLANFINGELWGRPTDVPWAMIFPRAPDALPRHPSQLYEALLEGVLLLIILQVGYRYLRWRERPGLTAGAFFLGYGLCRVFVEFFREPDAPFIGWLTMGQALSIPMWLIAGWLIWKATRDGANTLPKPTSGS